MIDFIYFFFLQTNLIDEPFGFKNQLKIIGGMCDESNRGIPADVFL